MCVGLLKNRLVADSTPIYTDFFYRDYSGLLLLKFITTTLSVSQLETNCVLSFYLNEAILLQDLKCHKKTNNKKSI